MGDTTAIEWCDKTWSPWWGCTQISTGPQGACEFCYAARLAHRFGVEFGAGQPRRLTSAAGWRKPLQWQRAAKRAGQRPFVFPSMCDPFDREVDPVWREWFFALMRATPDIVWLLLTKRPSMIEKLSQAAGGLPPNAALGATVVTAAEAARDVPALLRSSSGALFTFLSCEPLLGPINLRPLLVSRLDWVIAGGESGPNARPSHPDWFRALRDQCAVAQIPFLFKQWGEWAPLDASGREVNIVHDTGCEALMTRLGKRAAGRLLDGVKHDAFPWFLCTHALPGAQQ